MEETRSSEMVSCNNTAQHYKPQYHDMSVSSLHHILSFWSVTSGNG